MSDKQTGATHGRGADRNGGVSVKNITKSYADGAVRALDNFSLEFPAGQCTVLLGPSGCGKTTALRSIAGLIEPDEGRIEIDGHVVLDASSGVFLPPEKRHLGMVFQSYALWPHLSVAENIGYPLASQKMPKPQIAEKVAAILEWVSLAGMGDRFIHELSGGQQQRVSLARAMVAQPRAVLFDEPLSNLDARLREHMRVEISDLRQKSPFTAIYVTHDQLEAMTLGDRVVIMRAGKIEQIGSPEAVYHTPRTRFAADFMGIPNLIDGVVREVAGDLVAVDTLIGVVQARGWRTDWTPGAGCTVAMRSTLLELAPAERAGAARVKRSIFQGLSTLHIVDVGGVALTVESFSDVRLPEGSDVTVRPAPNAVFALLDD
ncbi:MAG: ABC transporter ATP-binding protein [Microvirga sp.]|nr:ABC transporter ATP-binding protein [Microvirga sp.]